MIRRAAIALAILFITTPAGSQEPTPEFALAEQMTGDFVAHPPSDEQEMTDSRRAIPALGEGAWVYLQVRRGTGSDLYRQRVLQLIALPDGSVVQRTYSLPADAQGRDLIADTEGLHSLVVDDLKATMSDGCDFVWKVQPDQSRGEWRAKLDPENCTIYSSRRNARIGIGAESRIGNDYLWLAERGYDLEGNQLWGSPEGEFTKLRRAATK